MSVPNLSPVAVMGHGMRRDVRNAIYEKAKTALEMSMRQKIELGMALFLVDSPAAGVVAAIRTLSPDEKGAFYTGLIDAAFDALKVPTRGMIADADEYIGATPGRAIATLSVMVSAAKEGK